MTINALESFGITGVQVDLSFQEIIAIKDKWQSIFNKNAELSVYEQQRNIVKVSLEQMKEMDVFISQIVGDVPSTTEVHDSLFGVGHTNIDNEL